MIPSLPISSDLRRSMLESIWLEPEHYDQARQISEAVINEHNQWRTYLNGLALFGFEQWFRSIASDLTLDIRQCSLFQPAYANVISAITSIHIGDFRLCLVATDNILNDEVIFPQAVFELSDFSAHFYGVIEVREEQEHLIFRGLLRRDKFNDYRKLSQFQSNWSCSLPLSLFDPEPNHLLFNLQHLSPSTIAIPETALLPLDTEVLEEINLDQLLAHLQTPNHQISQHLNWKQGAVVLSCSTLNKLLYQWQKTPNAELQQQIYQTWQNILPTQLEVPPNSSPQISLMQWLGDLVNLGWQSLDTLVEGKHLNLAYRSKTLHKADICQTKVLHLSSQTNILDVMLLLAFHVEEDKRRNIRLQIHPSQGSGHLPDQIVVKLLGTSGQMLQTIVSGAEDDFIQLKRFKCRSGQQFAIQVEFADYKSQEWFVV